MLSMTILCALVRLDVLLALYFRASLSFFKSVEKKQEVHTGSMYYAGEVCVHTIPMQFNWLPTQMKSLYHVLPLLFCKD